MSNWETKALTTALTGAETAPVNQAGVSKYTTINMIKAFIASAFEAAGSITTAITAHLAAFAHGDIAHTNRAQLNLVTGTNTGDQDLSAFAPVTGTWVPTDESGASLALTGGTDCRYTKIGNLVFLTGSITFPTNASTLVAQIGGLPFVSPDDVTGSMFCINHASLAGVAVVVGGTNRMRLWIALGGASGIKNNTLSAGGYYLVNITYKTA